MSISSEGAEESLMLTFVTGTEDTQHQELRSAAAELSLSSLT